MTQQGDWSKLTDRLKSVNKEEIVFTDEKIQEITQSQDNRRPYPLDFPSDPLYSIRNRAQEAGYNVKQDGRDHRVKIFKKQKTT